MDEDNTPKRRSADLDAHLNKRLDQLEKDLRSIERQFFQHENSLNMVKETQSHLREMIGARFSVLEDGHKSLLSLIQSIDSKISLFTTDMDKSPVGKSLLSEVQRLTHSVSDAREGFQSSLNELNISLKSLTTWKDNVDGVIKFFSWVGFAMLLTIVGLLIRLAWIGGFGG